MAKNKIIIDDMLDLIPISRSTYNKYKSKINFLELYHIFNNDKLATREKRSYLRDIKGLDRDEKDVICDAYIGDSLYDLH